MNQKKLEMSNTTSAPTVGGVPDHPQLGMNAGRAEEKEQSLKGGDYDPYNIPQHESGAKLDATKPDFSLLDDFSLALFEMVRVATYGAKKYSRSGWTTVPDGIKRYSAAMLRHYFSEPMQEFDTESGMMEAAMTAWNSMARLELKLRKKFDESSKQKEGLRSGSSVGEVSSIGGDSCRKSTTVGSYSRDAVSWRYSDPQCCPSSLHGRSEEEKEWDGVQGSGAVDGWKGYSFPKAK